MKAYGSNSFLCWPLCKLELAAATPPITCKELIPDECQETKGCFPVGFMWVMSEVQFQNQRRFHQRYCDLCRL